MGEGMAYDRLGVQGIYGDARERVWVGGDTWGSVILERNRLIFFRNVRKDSR